MHPGIISLFVKNNKYLIKSNADHHHVDHHHHHRHHEQVDADLGEEWSSSDIYDRDWFGPVATSPENNYLVEGTFSEVKVGLSVFICQDKEELFLETEKNTK
jgi:hypothetical protein